MRRLTSIFVVVVFAFACNTPPVDSPAENALTKKIDTYLMETVDRLKLPGLNIAVTRNDSVIRRTISELGLGSFTFSGCLREGGIKCDCTPAF